MASKHPKIKNAIVAVTDNAIAKEEHAEKDAEIKNPIVGSDNRINEKADKKEGNMKNLVDSDRINEEDDDETGTETPSVTKNMLKKDAGIKNLDFFGSDNRINEKADKKEGKMKNLVDSDRINEEDDEETGIETRSVTKNMLKKDAAIKNLDVGSDNINSIKEGKMKNLVDSDRINEEDDDKTGTGLGVSMDKLNLGSKKKLIVLPISGFLVHRAHFSRVNTILKNRHPDFSSGYFMIYKRPFCERFLKFCFERFEVGIWSSVQEHNIDGVLTKVMGELKSKLLFTWDQKHCTKTEFMCLDNKDKPVFLKELDHIWKEYGYSSSNTLLITDPVKALLNPPNTAISLESYDPENKKDDLFGLKGELRVFLDGLAEAKDVQSYVKDHPFGEPFITPSHADWDYYSKIIRAYDKSK